MPTYEYECARCGHTFERFQSITEKRLQRCPECRGSLRRLIGAGAGIIFRGSGFYQTDYRSGDYAKQAKKEETSSTTSSSSTDGAKKESKESSKTDAATPAKAAKSE